MSEGYILDTDGEPLRVDDLMTWARAFEHCNRRVALEEAAPGIRVSTVFLGLDHNFSDQGPPILWETMAFDKAGGKWDQYQQRCSGAREQAEAMHAHVVRRVRTAARRRKARHGPPGAKARPKKQ